MSAYDFMLIALGVLPSAVIMLIILKNAVSKKKKPLKKIASVFAISALSLIPAGIIEIIGGKILSLIMNFDPDAMRTDEIRRYLLYLLIQDILIVGAVEEAFKFLTFKWIIFHDRDFDNTYDGLIYGAASALGFATVENLIYIFQASNSLSTAIMRALLSIPLHSVTGIFMGYYFGISKYRKYNNLNLFTHPEIGAYIFSALLHGLYNFSALAYSSMSEYDDCTGTHSPDTPLYLIALFCIVAICYIMIIVTVKRAKKNSHNIYNRYYYEQLSGEVQDIIGGKTTDKKIYYNYPVYSVRTVQTVQNVQTNYPEQTAYPQTAKAEVRPISDFSGICRHCGVRFSPGSKYCGICGNKLK